jgi:hypothetical protein
MMSSNTKMSKKEVKNRLKIAKKKAKDKTKNGKRTNTKQIALSS